MKKAVRIATAMALLFAIAAANLVGCGSKKETKNTKETESERKETEETMTKAEKDRESEQNSGKSASNESDIVEIINGLTDLIALQPATDAEVKDAEAQLGVCFNEEYKKYVLAFGAIMAQEVELTGIAKSEYRNVVDQTQLGRELNPQVPDTMYVIEDPCIDGIMIWQDADGRVYQSYPDDDPEKIADSLSEYILIRCADN